MHKHKYESSNERLEMLDPDARFILANERTLLAWIRTALAILAGGIAFLHFNEKSNLVITTGLCIVVLGGLTSIIALRRFNQADTAIRSGTLPLTGKGPSFQVGLVLIFTVFITLVEIARL